MKDYPNLRQRAFIVAVNFSIFYGAFVVTAGLWLPTSGLESLWLLSGISLWLFSLLSSPWFRPPRDTFANAITAAVLLITADLFGLNPRSVPLEILRVVGIGWAVLVAVVSFLAMIRQDKQGLDPLGALLRRICDTLGRGEVVYTPAALLGILGGFGVLTATVTSLLVLWIVMMLVRPVELAFQLWRQFRQLYTCQSSGHGGY